MTIRHATHRNECASQRVVDVAWVGDGDARPAIADVLTDMDAELAASEQRREKTRALKLAMMQALFTGRTQLVKSREINP